MSALNITTAALINVPGNIDQEIISNVRKILQTPTTSQLHVIALDRAHGLICRSTREMDKVFRSCSDRDRTMGRTWCNGSPILPSPEARQPIDEAILTAAAVIVKPTLRAPARVGE
jgi:hypothetical protein